MILNDNDNTCIWYLTNPKHSHPQKGQDLIQRVSVPIIVNHHQHRFGKANTLQDSISFVFFMDTHTYLNDVALIMRKKLINSANLDRLKIHLPSSTIHSSCFGSFTVLSLKFRNIFERLLNF